MDSSRAEVEAESRKLRAQINEFETKIINLRGNIKEVLDENESLRRELRCSVEERFPGVTSTTMASLNNDSVLDLHKAQLEMLEQERDDLQRLCEQSREIILQLREENSDLRNPMRPHLIKLEMENRQAEEDHAHNEVELLREIEQIRHELMERSRQLMNSQIRIKELERDNSNFRIDLEKKQDDLRRYLSKDMNTDATLLEFQRSMNELEVRYEQALRDKSLAEQQRDDFEFKLKNLTQRNHSLENEIREKMEELEHQVHHSRIDVQPVDLEQNQIEHERMHRTIDELIEQAAMKARDAVEEVREQYNDNLEKIMQEYNRLEADYDQKNLELEKFRRAKRLVDEELEKILQERRLNLEKASMDHDDLAKRCFQAERERDEIQLKLEQTQQALKLLEQSFQAEKNGNEIKHQELMDRYKKVSLDLDKMTSEFTMTFNELNELKKKTTTAQNENVSLQRKMTDLIKRHEEQILEKEKDCLQRLEQRDQVNRNTFNELRNLVNQQQRMIVKYKEECHTIASQCENKIGEYKSKIEHFRSRNEQLQSEMSDLQRRDAEMNRVLSKSANRIKSLEERLHDAEEQAIEASRRVAKQLVRDRLAIMPSDHYSNSTHLLSRPHQSSSFSGGN